jgi:uncharacterized protein YqgV (UPF0045/DUF77 family)
MELSVEISLYPLQQEYVPVIRAFIDRVNTYDNLTVITNDMSTQIFGDYDLIMDVVRDEMRKSFEAYGRSVFVCKFIDGNLHQ